MNMKRMRKALSCILCMVLIVAMALFTTGCNDKAAKETPAVTTAAAETTSAATQTEAAVSEAAEEVTVLGEGSKEFCFSVVDLDGNETWFEVHTDEEIVGAALLYFLVLK